MTRDHVFLLVGVVIVALCIFGAMKHEACPKCRNKAAQIYQISALRQY
jgi:hypothetical protein